MQVKKTTKKTVKKAAKRTYRTKKTPPKPRKITLEELVELQAKTEASIDRLSAENRKTFATVAENHAKVAENHAKTETAIQGLSAAIASLIAQNDRTSALVGELTANLGHVSNDLGELMEFIVIPKIRLALNATGKHDFKTMQTERKLKKNDALGEKKTLTEVDVLLYGDTEVMAVETKSHLVTRDVRKHIERLGILRQNEDLVGIGGKKLIGAVIGAIVDEGAKDFALENGLYVVKIREEEGKLDIAEPETCRTW